MNVCKKYMLPLLLLVLLTLSCEKTGTQSEPAAPERELSIPEKLESKFTELISRGWPSLVDTLAYFNTNILQKGKLRGYGPDRVYYELKLTPQEDSLACVSFLIQDSVHLKAIGKLLPTSLTVYACSTKVLAQMVDGDSLALDVETIGATLPSDFLTDSLATAPLRFEGDRVGYLSFETYEDENYVTDTYLVLHYDNDSRTFAFNDVPEL